MKNLIATAITVAAATGLGVAAPLLANQSMDNSQANASQDRADWTAQSPEIVERNDRGMATKVRIDGKVYDVCMNADQDSCINPRAAGLNWGNRPLTYWPGQPASSM